MPKFDIERASARIGDASPEQTNIILRRNGETAGGDAMNALKVKAAGVVTSSVVISLVLVPEALAKLSANHNEILLTRD